MNNYLAKSNPKETIQEHTNNLLKNLEKLKQIYPDLKINWDMLEIACLYHDLGKMNIKFQNKIENGIKDKDEIAHNFLSLAFLDAKELKENYNFSNEDIEIIAQSIAYHHDRGDYNDENYDREVELLKKEVTNFKYDKINISRVKRISVKYFSNNRMYGNTVNFLEYVKIKGLLNRLDYAASGNIDVEIKNDFLNKGLDIFYENKLKPKNYNWNELQNFMRDNTNNNVVVVAQTGMGKTEAGLLWIGNNKGFFTLPLKTAINEIYRRIVKEVVGNENKLNIGLLHSDTFSKYLENKSEDEDVEEYYSRTKQMSLPLTVCTLDQIFDFVFRYRDFEPKLATLAYSKVVIDEVQMYSPDLLAYLILGLSYIRKIGGKFAILTATLPKIVTDLMAKEGIDFIPSEKPFVNDMLRHSIKLIDSEMDSDLIASKYNNNKILVICNTVKKAQEVYAELINNDNLKSKNVKINLIHSKFIKRDRKIKENDIVNLGDYQCQKSEIWVATQVVEASLDIDFDLLFTELSDINGLFQRLGRCYRKREFKEEGYNCYVFNGGEKECSGVKYVVDQKIFELSKEALKDINGKISEHKKLQIIDGLYTTDKLKDTEYYKKVLSNIEYIKNLNEYELSKSEVRKKFRNINSITVIPEIIYKGNYDLIEKSIIILNREVNDKMTKQDIKELRLKKQEIRNSLKNLTLDMNYYEYEKANQYGYADKNGIELDQYTNIPIIKYDYTFERGLVPPLNEELQDSNLL